MEKYILLVKGEKGLYYSDGKRIYFPDRSWKDVKEGIAMDVEITKDKGNYAFIKGTMIETKEIAEAETFYALSMDELTHSTLAQLGNSQILILNEFRYIQLYANIDGVLTSLCIFNVSAYRKLNRKFEFLILATKNVDVREELDKKWYERNCKIKNKDEFMQACINLYSRYQFMKSIELIDNLYIYITYETSYNSTVVVDIKSISTNDSICDYYICDFKPKGTVTYSITRKEIEDEMVKLRITGKSYIYSSYEKELQEKFGDDIKYIFVEQVKIFNQTFDFYCLKSCTFNYHLLETDLYKEVSRLHDSYIKSIQSFGKKCSGKQMIEQLQSASPRKLMTERGL